VLGLTVKNGAGKTFFGRFWLFSTALFVLFATAAGAGVIAANFGHFVDQCAVAVDYFAVELKLAGRSPFFLWFECVPALQFCDRVID